MKSVDFQKQGSKLKSSSQSFFETIGSIIMFFLKVIAKFIGIILIIVGISVLIGLIIAFFTVGITDALHFPGMDFIDASNAANIPIWLMSLLLFFVVGIPFFFVFYLGLKILVNNLKSIGNVAKFTLLGLWIMAIIGLIIMGVKQVTEYAYDATIVQEEKQLNISAMDTLNLSMMSHDIYNENFSRNYEHYNINPIDNGKNIISSSDIRIVIKQTSDSLASIKIHSYASGSNYDLARERAQNIDYNYAFDTDELKLDAYFTTEGFNKFSDQHIEIYLYLPVGTVIHTDNYVSRYRKFYNSPHNLLQRDMENHYYKIIPNDTECLDCFEAIQEEETEKEVDLDDVIEAAAKKIIKETSETSASGVNININDDDGVNIEVIDN